MSKAKARVFVPLTKVDEEKRLVYGRITQEELDKAGEVMDYDTSKPLFEKWSSGIEKATNGLSKGNVRVMHGLVAAGKLTELDFNDDEKAIDVCAKIVDDNEWQKTLEGVYTGFSVGGNYEKKWTETVDGVKIKKYTANPLEVSIVDNPCVTSATFSLVKADGSEQEVMFKNAGDKEEEIEEKTEEKVEKTETVDPENYVPSNQEVAEKAESMAKAAGQGKTWADFINEAREELIKDFKAKAKKEDDKDATEEGEEEGDKKTAKDKKADKDKTEKVTPAGVKQVWTASDGTAFEKKADAEAHEDTIERAYEEEDENDPAVKLRKALARVSDAVNSAENGDEEETLFTDFDRLEKAFLELDQPREPDGTPKLEKGMYTVSRFANLLGDVASLARSIKKEGSIEGGDTDDASAASTLRSALGGFGDAFKTYATNQVAELLAGVDVDVVQPCCDYYYRAAEADPDNQLMKDVCSLIDASKEDIKEVLEKRAPQDDPDEEDDEEDTDELRKSHSELQKRYDNLEKASAEAIAQIGGLVKRVSELEKSPMPRAPKNIPVEKSADHGFFKPGASETEKLDAVQELLKTHGPDGLATMLIKASHATGGHKMSVIG